jgi:putative chitinase
MISIPELIKIMPGARYKAALFISAINKSMVEFNINTPVREAAFLAQIAHESGQLVYMKELASGNAYEGRRDLGNTQAGDGVRYKGRGLIQVTGKINYFAIMLATGIDCIEHPELLETPENATRVSAWWWNAHGCNEIADGNTDESFIALTRRINGGTNGLADRRAFWLVAKQVKGV